MILRLEKTRLESEQEPPFGGTKRAQCSLSPNNVIKPVWELGLEGVMYEGGQLIFDTSEHDAVLKMPWF